MITSVEQPPQPTPVGHQASLSRSPSPRLRRIPGILPRLQNAHRDQLLRLRAILDFMLEAVGAHRALEFLRIGLQRGGCVEGGEDIAYGGSSFISTRAKVQQDDGRGRERVRSISASRSGRRSRFFFRLSEVRWRTRSWEAPSRDLAAVGQQETSRTDKGDWRTGRRWSPAGCGGLSGPGLQGG